MFDEVVKSSSMVFLPNTLHCKSLVLMPVHLPVCCTCLRAFTHRQAQTGRHFDDVARSHHV